MEEDTIFTITVDASEADAELGGLDESMAGVGDTMMQVAASFQEAGAGMEESLANIGAAADGIAGSFDGMAQSGGAASTALDGVATSADTTGGSIDAAATSLAGLAAALDAASASATQNAAALDANTASLNANRGAALPAAVAHTKLAAAAGAMVMPLGIATAAVIGIGAVAVHMAGDFQEGITSLVTGAGEAESNIGLISQGIMALSQSTGQSTSQLISGLYMIESAGFHGAAGLDVLKAAAEGAKVGQADLGVVSDATTTILVDYAKSHITATGAVNLLIATVANGKTHMQDLAASLSKILPTASAAGIGLNDVMGAMATMTGEAVPADQAATFLRQTILALEAPSKQTTTALKNIGLSTTQVAAAMHKSLPGALQLITDHLKKKFPEGSAAYVAALKNIAGGSKQMQGILDLTGDHLKAFQTNTKTVTDAVKHGGNTVTGWTLVQKDFNTQMAQGMASLSVAMIKIGQVILPVAASFLHNLQPALAWIAQHAQAVAIGLGILAAVLGGALVAALYMVAAGFWAVILPALPFIAIGAAIGLAIALLVVGIIYLHNHWKQLGDWLSGVWNNIVKGIGGFFSNLGTQAHKLWDDITQAFTGGTQKAGDAFSGLGKIPGEIWQEIQNIFHAGVAWVEGQVQAFVDRIVGFFVLLYNHSYLFQHIVDFIHSRFENLHRNILLIWSLITGVIHIAWVRIQQLIAAALAFVKMIVARDWALIERFIIVPVERIVAQVRQRFEAVVTFLSQIWDHIKTDVADAWNAILSWISSLTGRVHSTVQASVVNPIQNLMNGLGSFMKDAGTHLMQMLIDGINNMVGGVKRAAGNIANGIKSLIGWHSPTDEGPGADSDQWMPNLGTMLVAGLHGTIARVGAEATAIAAAISAGIHSATAGGLSTTIAGRPAIPQGLGTTLAGPPSAVAGGALYAGAGALGGLGSGNSSILTAMLAELRGLGSRLPALGNAPLPTNLGSVSQNFHGGINLNGVQNIAQLYAQLAALSGLALEDGVRGALAGSAF